MDDSVSLTAHHIRFEVEAVTPLLLPAYPGPSIRGALFGALRRHFCALGPGERATAEHKAQCPVCWLMSTEQPDGGRGRDVPRPYTIEPPVEGASPDGKGSWFEPGQRFSFGLTLFAQAMNLFPYAVLAVPIIGQRGLGVPLRENADDGAGKQRGRFRLCRVCAVNPVTGEMTPVMAEGEKRVHVPDLPATEEDVSALTRATLGRMEGRGRVCVSFYTPTRIVEAGRLVKRPWLGPLTRRLIERLDALRGAFAGLPPLAGREQITALADQVRLVEDQTHWTEVRSESGRLGRSTWVSGYVGEAAYEASREAWQALLPPLLWGQATHAGKNATKGNGWYRVKPVR